MTVNSKHQVFILYTVTTKWTPLSSIEFFTKSLVYPAFSISVSKQHSFQQPVEQLCDIVYDVLVPYSPENKPPSKISSIPFLTSKFLHKYFTSHISPPPLRYKNCIVSKNKRAKIDKDAVFVVWMVCFPHLSALSVIYHGQSIEINSKRPFMVVVALAIGLGYDHGWLAV